MVLPLLDPPPGTQVEAAGKARLYVLNAFP